MARKLTVVVSQGQSANPAKRKLEEDVVAGLLFERGVEVTVVPHLYDLAPDGTGMLCLQGISGDMVVLTWLFDRAAFWTLDRNGIRGREGKSLLVSEQDDDEFDADGEEEQVAAADEKQRVRLEKAARVPLDSKIDGLPEESEHVETLRKAKIYEIWDKRDRRVIWLHKDMAEPLDVLEGIRRVLVQLEEGRAELENAYPRAVSAEGNLAAQAVVRDVFEVCDRIVVLRLGRRVATFDRRALARGVARHQLLAAIESLRQSQMRQVANCPSTSRCSAG